MNRTGFLMSEGNAAKLEEKMLYHVIKAIINPSTTAHDISAARAIDYIALKYAARL